MFLVNQYIFLLQIQQQHICKKVNRPVIAIEAKELDHINTKRKIQGKATWENVTIEMYDPVVPSGAQAVMEWVRLGYESVTGRAGYADFYKKNVTINVLGPVGDKVEEWTLMGAFPVNATFGDLEWATDDPINISLELAYDYAILQY